MTTTEAPEAPPAAPPLPDWSLVAEMTKDGAGLVLTLRPTPAILQTCQSNADALTKCHTAETLKQCRELPEAKALAEEARLLRADESAAKTCRETLKGLDAALLDTDLDTLADRQDALKSRVVLLDKRLAIRRDAVLAATERFARVANDLDIQRRIEGRIALLAQINQLGGALGKIGKDLALTLTLDRFLVSLMIPNDPTLVPQLVKALAPQAEGMVPQALTQHWMQPPGGDRPTDPFRTERSRP
jgi:hypothetical protein